MKKQFKKSDLKTGMLVEFGSRVGMVINQRIITNNGGYKDLIELDEDMVEMNSINPISITKVSNVVNFGTNQWHLSNLELNLLWKRPVTLNEYLLDQICRFPVDICDKLIVVLNEIDIVDFKHEKGTVDEEPIYQNRFSHEEHELALQSSDGIVIRFEFNTDCVIKVIEP